MADIYKTLKKFEEKHLRGTGINLMLIFGDVFPYIKMYYTTEKERIEKILPIDAIIEKRSSAWLTDGLAYAKLALLSHRKEKSNG